MISGNSPRTIRYPDVTYVIMHLAHYYYVDRELHELKYRGQFLIISNEIMGKFGALILLSYLGLVSYVTRKGFGFVRVLPGRSAVNHCTASGNRAKFVAY